MDFSGLINLQLMMFVMMAVGAFLRKKGIITTEGKMVLTDLIIVLILPCNIITTFCVEFNLEILRQGTLIFIICLLLELGSVALALLLYRRYDKDKRMILQYGTICSNAGFLGNPVVQGIYGDMGLLYASIYLIPQRIIMWSVGVSFFTETPNKKQLVKKVVTHPCIVAVFIGVLFMVFQVKLPTFLDQGLRSIGGCTTAITMLLIGTILAEVDLKTMITKTTIWFSLLRLVLIPALVLLGCVLFQVPFLITGVSVILAAMPAGATTVILATKYDGDEEFATKCVVLTTLLSMVLIPVWCVIIDAIFI